MNKTAIAAINALDEIYNEVDNTFSVLQLMSDAFDDDMACIPENNLFAARFPIYQGTISVVMNQLHHLLETVGASKDIVSSVGRQVPPPETHLRRYTHELHHRKSAELNKRHGSVFGAVPFLFFGDFFGIGLFLFWRVFLHPNAGVRRGDIPPAGVHRVRLCPCCAERLRSGRGNKKLR